MFKFHQIDFRIDDMESADRQTASLAALAFALALVVVGLCLVKALHEKSTLEDCLLSGRTNCQMIIPHIR
jgi:hypothetical protein